MKNLFQQKSLAAKLDEYCLDDNWFKTAQEIFNRWNAQVDLSKEKENQQPFLQEFFGAILGYQAIPGKKDNSLWWESGSKVDSTKPDGILGFNLLSYKAGEIDNQKIGDIRVVIELKDAKTNLDAKQNRKNSNYSPVEQAFSYASKVGGNCEFVIVSNFIETRLYLAGDQSRAHVFFLKDLAASKEKQKEFHFLLAKNRLFSLSQRLSPTHNLNKTPSGKEIEEKFYAHYKNLRQDIWQDLIKLNTNPKFSKNFYLYKAQKLIDRIIFIRFCRENGALDNDAVLEALNNKLIPGKYNRLKLLFSAMNLGNPEIGIAKFNGGLFAPDFEMDELQVSDLIIDKIKTLYDYDFGSDLDINILGHIFEQSISDLENLTNSNEKKRKKEGIFYTPPFVTKYIVESAVGGWLDDQKVQIKAKENSTEFWQEYANKLGAIKVLDPACGSGAFLVEVFDFLQKQWHEVSRHIKANFTYLDILTKNIFGVDLNPTSVGITKLSLWLKTAHHRQPLCALDDNIKIGNSLIDDKKVAGFYHEFEGRFVQETIDAQGGLFAQEDFSQSKKDIEENFKKSLAFKWHQEFPQVFAPTKNDSKQSGFDVVVGNPPYVGISDIEIENRRYFEKNYQSAISRFDLYSLFIERAFSLSQGNLSFIIPVKYLSNIQFAKSREMLVKKGLVKISNIAKKVFDQAQVESVILFFKKDASLAGNYQNCSFDESGVAEISSRILPENNHVFHNSCDNSQLLEKIEQNTVALEKIADVRDGIVAGRIKDLLFLKKPIDQNSKPLLFGKDVERYFVEAPTNWVNYKIKEMNEEELKRANKSRIGLWMRSEEIFERPKILTRQVGVEVIGSIENENFYYEHTLHSTHVTNPNYHQLFILTLFNSKLFKFYYKTKNAAGGKIFPQIRIAFLKQLPIKILEPSKQNIFVEKAQKMLDLNQDFHQKVRDFLDYFCQKFSIKKATRNLCNWHQLGFGELTQEISKQKIKLESDIEFEFKKLFEKQKLLCQNLQNQISQTDNEIDALVYQIYQLEPAEIELIENLNSNFV